jgi:hypothetical protein
LLSISTTFPTQHSPSNSHKPGLSIHPSRAGELTEWV